MHKHITVSKSITDFFPATTTPISVARVLVTLKAVHEELSTHSHTLVDNEAMLRKATDDSLAARIATLEHAAALVPPAPEPPAPEPPALTPAAASSNKITPTTHKIPPSTNPLPAAASTPHKSRNYTHPFIRTYHKGDKLRYSLQFKHKHMKDIQDKIDKTSFRRVVNYGTLQACQRDRDKIILAAGCFISHNASGRASLRKLKV